MADFERLIPSDVVDIPRPVARSSSFTRMSLARFSQRLCRRGWTVGMDDGTDGQDKENAVRLPPTNPLVVKRVKFDKRVYHGPVWDRSGTVAIRGILKTSSAAAAGRTAVGQTNAGYDDGIPNRMRMYEVPVTSFYIGAAEHLQLEPAASGPGKRCSSAAVAGGHEFKKTRRFGTDIGS